MDEPRADPTTSTADRWADREAAAEAMIPIVGRLHRAHGVVTSIYGRSLVGEPVFGVLKAHRFARRVDGVELEPRATLAVLAELDRLQLGPASIDLGRLLARLHQHEDTAVGPFLRQELGAVIGAAHDPRRPATDVVLYGFGRIGRLVARLLIQHSGDGNALRLRAVVVRGGGPGDLAKRASLLRRDSVHGPFQGTVAVDEARSMIIANGTEITVLYSDDPGSLDYERHGITDAVVVDNTGRWRDEAGLSRHLASRGVARVVLTAPGTGRVKNVVHGINHRDITADDVLVAAASCTTNAVAPVLKAVHDEFGLVHGHVETVHSFTNDQNLIDNHHRADRRGRSAVLNMVIAETGAARAVAKVVPELDGLLTASSIRVPTPNVSLAVLTLQVGRAVDKGAVNAFLRGIALDSPLHRQVDYTESTEIVSSDVLGSRKAGVVDGSATIATGGTQVVLYVWYDNESGYSSQVVRVLETMTGEHPPVLPAPAAPVAAEGPVPVGAR